MKRLVLVTLFFFCLSSAVLAGNGKSEDRYDWRIPGDSYLFELEMGFIYPYLRQDTGQLVYDEYALTRDTVRLSVPWWNIGFYGFATLTSSLDNWNQNAGDELRYGGGIHHVFEGKRSYPINRRDGAQEARWIPAPVAELDIRYARENRQDFADDWQDYDTVSLWLSYRVLIWRPELYAQVKYFHPTCNLAPSGGTSWTLGLRFGQGLWHPGRCLYFWEPVVISRLYVMGHSGLFDYDAELVSAAGFDVNLAWDNVLFWGMKVNIDAGYQQAIDNSSEDPINPNTDIGEDYQKGIWVGASLAYSLKFK